MADWDSINLSTFLKTDLPGLVHDRTISNAKMDHSSDTNIATGTIDLDRSTGAIEEYDGSSWDYPDCLDYTEIDLGTSGILDTGSYLRYNIFGRMLFFSVSVTLDGTATANGNLQVSISSHGLPSARYSSYVIAGNNQRFGSNNKDYVKFFLTNSIFEVLTGASEVFSNDTYIASGFYII